jgi:hypothetical protein
VITDSSDLDAALILLQSAFRTELDYMQLEAYRQGLAGFSGENLKKAASEAIKTEKTFPSIATIREFAAAAHRSRMSGRELPAYNEKMPDSVTQEGLKLLRECYARMEKKFAWPKTTVPTTPEYMREPGEEG